LIETIPVLFVILLSQFFLSYIFNLRNDYRIGALTSDAGFTLEDNPFCDSFE